MCRKQSSVDDESSSTYATVVSRKFFLNKIIDRSWFFFQLPPPLQQEESSPDSEITSEVNQFLFPNFYFSFYSRWMINLMMIQHVEVSIVHHAELISHLG